MASGGQLNHFIGSYANDTAANTAISGETAAYGLLYRDTTLSLTKFWDGGAWVPLSSSASSIFQRASGIITPINTGDTLQIGNGTIDKPALSFENDTDSGVRLSAVGEVSVTIGASDIGVFDSDGLQVYDSLGIGKAPTSAILVRTSDVDDTNDTIGIQTGLDFSTASTKAGWTGLDINQINVGNASGEISGPVYGIHIESPSGPGEISDSYYGIRIEDPMTSTVSGDGYGIYVAGENADNIIQGRLVVGDSAGISTATLSVEDNNTTTSTSYGVAANLDWNSGTKDDWYGFYASSDFADGTSSNDIFGFYFSAPNTNTTGDIGNDLYGLYIEDLSSTGVGGSRYAIYASGASDRTYINGNVGIGRIPLATIQLGVEDDTLVASSTGFAVNLDNGGTKTLWKAVAAGADINTGTSLDYLYHFYIDAMSGTGTIDNDVHGLYIEDFSTSSVTITGDSYAIYQTGSSDLNFFGGFIGVGQAPGSLGRVEIDDVRDLSALLTTYGVSDILYKNGSNSSASYYGFNTGIQINTGNGTLTNWRALNVASPTGTALGTTISNVYGLYIDDLKSGPADAATSYAIYQVGSDDSNYFAGNAGINSLPSSNNALTLRNDGTYDANIRSYFSADTSTGSYYGLYKDTYVGDGGILTDCYPIIINTETEGTGDITNTYRAIYIGPGPTATATTYGIYITYGHDYNYFGDPVGINDNSPSEMLSVSGNATFTGQMSIGNSSIQSIDQVYIENDSSLANALRVRTDTTVNVTNCRQLYIQRDINTGDTVTNCWGIYIESPTGSGTVSSMMGGIYIEELDTGPASGATTTYAIHQSGTIDENYFQGYTGFRTTPSSSYAINAGASVNTFGYYYVDGTKVVGNRRTGWSYPIGTATRSAFTTSTVTTEGLAERVHALIDDLLSHGIIGT